MTIQEYSIETRFATTKIIEAIWQDFDVLQQLTQEVKSLAVSVEQGYQQAHLLRFYAEDGDDVMDGTARHWETYFGDDKQLSEKRLRLDALSTRIAARRASIDSLSASLLEHAKKGLSIAFGKPTSWPKMKSFGSVPMSAIILQARNQSAHFDEALKQGGFNNKQISEVFNTLALETDPIFAKFNEMDQAFEVVKLFNWVTVEVYEKDLANL